VIYRQFQDKKLSWLGFGCMRLPMAEDKTIDEQKAMDMVDRAYKNGVNYFDTAYFYHSGNSQRFLAKALNRYPRDTWFLGSKLPGNMMSVDEKGIHVDVKGFGMENKTFANIAEVFEYQLKECGVDYFDFYMLHNIAEGTYSLYTDEKLGFVDYLLEQKKAGRIKHLGFSAHGRPETIESFLKWRNCFEFALLQLNYLDWDLQEAGKKYEILTKYGVPVFVMEPVRGGKLANPDEKVLAILKSARPDDTAASWAFRYLQSLPNVACVVSGNGAINRKYKYIQ